MDIRYANHPRDVKKYTTEEIRRDFLIEKVFEDDKVNLTYSHVDRIIAGGVKPVEEILELKGGKELGSEYFLERRELGIINTGGEGKVTLDGVEYKVKSRDGLYVGIGVKEVKFQSINKENPAKFYINSAPAHKEYPIVKIEFEKAQPVRLGTVENSNKRTIYQYVHPNVCKSCQLLMGMTMLDEPSMWNTMPCHTHERRMEVYFYFDMSEETRVFHLIGEPQETRHIVVKNQEGVISPSWSIHSGVGTGNYTFIWGMVGENQTFTDMDYVAMEELK